jgi:hypothetical protein
MVYSAPIFTKITVAQYRYVDCTKKNSAGSRSIESSRRNLLLNYLNHDSRSEHFYLTNACWPFCKGIQHRILRKTGALSKIQSLIQSRKQMDGGSGALSTGGFIFYVLKIR